VNALVQYQNKDVRDSHFILFCFMKWCNLTVTWCILNCLLVVAVWSSLAWCLHFNACFRENINDLMSKSDKFTK
jgi:hypothetical protein